MSVNLDMEDGVYQTLARKTFSLRVQLDKEGLTALRINFGDSMEYVNYWGEDWDNLLATGVLETGAWFSSGDYEMYAQAYYGEAFWEDGSDDDSRFDPLWNEENPNYLDWDNNPQVVKSNVIPIHVTALGQLTQATAKITNAGASVYRGETVNVKVTKYDSNAENVYGYIFDGDNIVSPYGIRLNSEGMINLPTGTIAPGKYQVQVYSATEGWDYSITKLNLTIKQPAAGSVSFSVNKTNLFCGETLRMSGYAEGAAYFVIYDGRDMHDWEPFRGDGFAEETWPDCAVEDAEYRAYAYDENDVLIGVSDPIYITITSEGDTPLPTIGGPLVIAPGEDVTFTVGVDLPEGMEYSWFDLSVGEDGWDNELFRFTADDGALNAENEFTITGDHFEREGSYTIYLYVRADNYNGVEARHTILCSVNEERDDQVSMRVLLRGEEVNEVLSGEAFTVEVTAPGAKMVSIVANGDLLQCDPVGDGTFVTTYSRWSDTLYHHRQRHWQDLPRPGPRELTRVSRRAIRAERDRLWRRQSR